MSIFTTKLRTLVSQDRVRLEEMSVNIDLTYITERVVGIEAAWRNDIQDVCKLLRTKHKNNFLIFNLSERDYEYDLLDNQIVCFPFKDHHAPPLHIIFQIIFNMDSWLKANDSHVAIVHCIGGKGRTGLIVVCYLFFCGMFTDVDKCLEFFALRRSAKGKGVTQPSQLRYVRYFCGIVSNQLRSKEKDKTKSKMFRMQFHTGLVHRGEITVPKLQLDDLQKEKKKFQDFELRLSLESTDCPRNSMALYNMIFNQMKHQKKLVEESGNNSPRTNGSGNNSPNTSLSNFPTIGSPTPGEPNLKSPSTSDSEVKSPTSEGRPNFKRSTTIVGSHKSQAIALENQRLEELLVPPQDRPSQAIRSESPSNNPSTPPSPYSPPTRFSAHVSAPRNILSPASSLLGSTTITPVAYTSSPTNSPHSPLTFSNSPSFSSLVSLLARSPSVSSQGTPRAGAAREQRESPLRPTTPREDVTRERSDTVALREAVRDALRDNNNQSPPPQDWKDTTPSSWEHKRNAGTWRRASSPYPSRSNSNAPLPMCDLSHSTENLHTRAQLGSTPTHTQGMMHVRSESALDSATDSSSLGSSADSAGSASSPKSTNSTQSPTTQTPPQQEALRREYRKGNSHMLKEEPGL